MFASCSGVLKNEGFFFDLMEQPVIAHFCTPIVLDLSWTTTLLISQHTPLGRKMTSIIDSQTLMQYIQKTHVLNQKGLIYTLKGELLIK